MALPECTQLPGELLDMDLSDGGRSDWTRFQRNTLDTRARVAGPSELGTGLCVCGTQPADISLSHRRRNPFLRNNGAPCDCTGPQRSSLTPAVANYLYRALMLPHVASSTGVSQGHSVTVSQVGMVTPS